uniref:protein-tyrosine-phosphatase n=1 Tax=Corethron hystrix TaxID=216773 RepID=A0A7S1FRB9_9STRA|mmetsp:Transcript_22647/g.51891  ORF Transcript_22647/g.51891 Transcript_22647/m.51891 type:complete len:195 (+) Transcript_22647:251-835(+)
MSELPRCRSEIQEILPRIFLTSYFAVNRGKLQNFQKYGITHVICCAKELDLCHAGKEILVHRDGSTYDGRALDGEAPCRVSLSYLRLPLVDNPSQEILEHCRRAYEWIEDALRCVRCRVLLHCAAGCSRSAAVLIGYVMLRYRRRFEDALGVVRTGRPIVDINLGFETQLRHLETEVVQEDRGLHCPLSSVVEL